MKLKELETLAANICDEENAKRQDIENRIAAAKAKMETLKAQAAELANNRQFDEYADNIENQRKQQSIIDLARQLIKRPADQKEKNSKTAEDFAKKAQQAFDEDTAADWKELEKMGNKTAEIAERIMNKYERAMKCKNDVFTVYELSALGHEVQAPLSLCNTAAQLPKQFENMRDLQKRGIKVF